MYQEVDGLYVEVVDFETMPQLPITGLTEHEATYENAVSMARGFIHPMYDPNYPKVGKCAEALTDAIKTGVIKEPGKYGIYFPSIGQYEIYRIIEED